MARPFGLFGQGRILYEACRELHKDEEDAEYMFQDWGERAGGLNRRKLDF